MTNKEESKLTKEQILERNKLLESLGIIVCNRYRYEKENNYILSYSLFNDSTYKMPELISIKDLTAKKALQKVFTEVYKEAYEKGVLSGKNELRRNLKDLLEEDQEY